MTSLVTSRAANSASLHTPSVEYSGPLKEFIDPHTYLPPTSTDSRSPCPALNALANHGYLPRSGTQLTFPTLVHTVCRVYNLTYALSFILTLGGFLTCGRISRISAPPKAAFFRRVFYNVMPRWTLDLSALSKRTGFLHIAHDCSLVHPDGRPSTSPDPKLLAAFLAAPHTQLGSNEGFTLTDLAHVQAGRRQKLGKALDRCHKEIACGECGLTWMVIGDHGDSQRGDLGSVVPLRRVREWFGEERLPVGWVRPVKPIGILEARSRSVHVKNLEAEEGVI